MVCHRDQGAYVLPFHSEPPPVDTSSLHRIETEKGLWCMRLDEITRSQFACGGREQLLRIYDVEGGDLLFKARNVSWFRP